jgi:hypothetical protein
MAVTSREMILDFGFWILDWDTIAKGEAIAGANALLPPTATQCQRQGFANSASWGDKFTRTPQ